MATSLLIAVLLSVGPSLQGKSIESIVSINEAMWLLMEKLFFLIIWVYSTKSKFWISVH